MSESLSSHSVGRQSLPRKSTIQIAPYPQSYYAATKSEAPERSSLSRAVEADVCVIGGGLAGLTTALELQRRGQETVLLEANRIGWGASGRNGGFVSAGYSEGLSAIIAKSGLEDAQALYRLSREGAAYVRQRTAAWPDADINPVEGRLSVLRTDDSARLMATRDRLEKDFEHATVYWPTERVRDALHTERYFQGLQDPDGFHIHPLNYTLALAREAEQAGVTIYAGTRALALERKGGRHLVRCAGGQVSAGTLVFCTSGYEQRLFRPLTRALLPIATYMIASRTLNEEEQQTISVPYAISDERRAGDYYRLYRGRLLWGGRITTRREEPKALGQMLKQDVTSVYPSLGRLQLAYAWSGLMGYARHKMPLIGPCGADVGGDGPPRDGFWMATGFGGHGLNTTAMAGELIARAIVEKDDRWKLFRPYPLQPVGGALGQAAVQLTYWAMQLLDLLDERRSA